MAQSENCNFSSKIGEYFAIKVSNIRISQGILLIQKENYNLNMFCKFQLQTMKIPFKMAT